MAYGNEADLVVAQIQVLQLSQFAEVGGQLKRTLELVSTEAQTLQARHAGYVLDGVDQVVRYVQIGQAYALYGKTRHVLEHVTLEVQFLQRRQANQILDSADLVVLQVHDFHLLLSLKKRNVGQVAVRKVDHLGHGSPLGGFSIHNKDALDLRQLNVNPLVLRLKGVDNAILEQVTVTLISFLVQESLKSLFVWFLEEFALKLNLVACLLSILLFGGRAGLVA